MTRKRSHYRKNYSCPLQCPECSGALSRMNGKRFRICVEAAETGVNSRSEAKQTNQTIAVEPDLWLEEFYCPNDGRLWMAVFRLQDDRLRVEAPGPKLWKRAIGAVDPERNPSVGEFTWRESHSQQVR